ncbi:McrB family protein [Thermococcus prieurii]
MENQLFIIGIGTGTDEYENFEETILKGVKRNELEGRIDPNILDNCCSDVCYFWGRSKETIYKKKIGKGDVVLFYVGRRIGRNKVDLGHETKVYIGIVCETVDVPKHNASFLEDFWEKGKKFTFLIFFKKKLEKLPYSVEDINRKLGYNPDYFPIAGYVKPERIDDNLDDTLRDILTEWDVMNENASHDGKNGEGIVESLVESLLDKKGQVILYGPPGTGKTWLAREYVVKETNEDKPGDLWEFITFHQSYSYEEFIEGFRPKTDDNGNIRYEVEDGIFKKIALRALVKGLLELENASIDRDELQKLHGLLLKKEPLSLTEYEEYLRLKRYLWELVERLPDENLRELTPKFYLIIDEINRGNISKIFGELITLLEKDKRLGGENQLIVRLPYSGEPFAVPPNLYIIGTMNTADRSIALLDVALRRRFAFIEVEPRPEFLEKENLKKIREKKLKTEERQRLNEKLNELFSKLDNDNYFLKTLLEKINVRITVVKDRDHRIGHSYFLNVETVDDLKHVWYYEVLPLLMEYFYNDWETIKWVLNEKDRDSEDVFFKKLSITGPNGEKAYQVEVLDKNAFIRALKRIIRKKDNSSNNNQNNQTTNRDENPIENSQSQTEGD